MHDVVNGLDESERKIREKNDRGHGLIVRKSVVVLSVPACQLPTLLLPLLCALRETNVDTLHKIQVIHEKAQEAPILDEKLLTLVTIAVASQNAHQTALMHNSMVRMSVLSPQFNI